ncbi:[4Fe-4S] cluster assembly scaffold protein Mrp (=ApbC) [hydrothermal vent metagenome]|uniref:[4Fe-4S] cluster assembly scaffold protein Mrp (=ApbC) n=1 Tax=hydrothermal vent metagenome TaxID=652676 RepID=A0A3B1BCC6_9ZZZZ
MSIKEKALEALKSVNYPGFSKDIVSLGAVEEIESSPGLLKVKMRPISGADEKALEALAERIHKALGDVAESGEIEIAFGNQDAPKHEPHQGEGENVFVRKQIAGVKRVIPVISGKGGVGKSTVAVNIAHTLAKLGNKVGLLDLDIFGPSTHRMLGVKDRLLAHDNKITPSEAHGIKLVSVGMAVEEDEALVMRGPMVMKLINDLLNNVSWGELDYLIVDMPPGTGDVPLSLAQQIAISGAVVVTTPQDISLIDVRRAVAMFVKTETRILGLIENMSYYRCDNCGDVAHIFGSEGGAREAARLKLPLLGKIPLTKTICEGAEAGAPIFAGEENAELAKVFEEIAGKIVTAVNAEEAGSTP